MKLDQHGSYFASPFAGKIEEPIPRQSFGNDRDQFFRPYDEEQKDRQTPSYVSFKPQLISQPYTSKTIPQLKSQKKVV